MVTLASIGYMTLAVTKSTHNDRPAKDRQSNPGNFTRISLDDVDSLSTPSEPAPHLENSAKASDGRKPEQDSPDAETLYASANKAIDSYLFEDALLLLSQYKSMESAANAATADQLIADIGLIKNVFAANERARHLTNEEVALLESDGALNNPWPKHETLARVYADLLLRLHVQASSPSVPRTIHLNSVDIAADPRPTRDQILQLALSTFKSAIEQNNTDDIFSVSAAFQYLITAFARGGDSESFDICESIGRGALKDNGLVRHFLAGQLTHLKVELAVRNSNFEKVVALCNAAPNESIKAQLLATAIQTGLSSTHEDQLSDLERDLYKMATQEQKDADTNILKHAGITAARAGDMAILRELQGNLTLEDKRRNEWGDVATVLAEQGYTSQALDMGVWLYRSDETGFYRRGVATALTGDKVRTLDIDGAIDSVSKFTVLLGELDTLENHSLAVSTWVECGPLLYPAAARAKTAMKQHLLKYDKLLGREDLSHYVLPNTLRPEFVKTIAQYNDPASLDNDIMAALARANQSLRPGQLRAELIAAAAEDHGRRGRIRLGQDFCRYAIAILAEPDFDGQIEGAAIRVGRAAGFLGATSVEIRAARDKPPTILKTLLLLGIVEATDDRARVTSGLLRFLDDRTTTTNPNAVLWPDFLDQIGRVSSSVENDTQDRTLSSKSYSEIGEGEITKIGQNACYAVSSDLQFAAMATRRGLIILFPANYAGMRAFATVIECDAFRGRTREVLTELVFSPLGTKTSVSGMAATKEGATVNGARWIQISIEPEVYFLGLSLAPISDISRAFEKSDLAPKHGLVVLDVADPSIFDGKLKAGDILMKLDDIPLRTAEDAEQLNDIKSGTLEYRSWYKNRKRAFRRRSVTYSQPSIPTKPRYGIVDDPRVVLPRLRDIYF